MLRFFSRRRPRGRAEQKGYYQQEEKARKAAADLEVSKGLRKPNKHVLPCRIVLLDGADLSIDISVRTINLDFSLASWPDDEQKQVFWVYVCLKFGRICLKFGRLSLKFDLFAIGISSKQFRMDICLFIRKLWALFSLKFSGFLCKFMKFNSISMKFGYFRVEIGQLQAWILLLCAWDLKSGHSVFKYYMIIWHKKIADFTDFSRLKVPLKRMLRAYRKLAIIPVSSQVFYIVSTLTHPILNCTFEPKTFLAKVKPQRAGQLQLVFWDLWQSWWMPLFCQKKFGINHSRRMPSFPQWWYHHGVLVVILG